MKFKHQFLLEVSIRNIFVLLLFFKILLPWIHWSRDAFERNLQGPMLSMLGLVMAAATIGNFFLQYKKMEKSIIKRYLAHFTKALLYLAICMLMTMGLMAVGATPGKYNNPIVVACLFVVLALFIYDFWNAFESFDDE